MDLITPDIGLVFWTTMSFLALFFLLTKFAWKPIVNTIKQRNEFIEDSLLKAKKANEDMKLLQERSEEILRQAKQERERIIKEGEKLKQEIVDSSKEASLKEASKILENAKKSIEEQKNDAIKDIKNAIISVSLSMSEIILKQKLEEKDINNALLEQEIKNIRI